MLCILWRGPWSLMTCFMGGSPVMREKVAEKLFRQSCLACSSHLNLHCRPVSWPGLLIGSSVQSKKQCSALLTVCLAGTWKSIYRWPEGHRKQHPCGVNCFWPWHLLMWSESFCNLCADVVHINNTIFASCMKIFFAMYRAAGRWMKV